MCFLFSFIKNGQINFIVQYAWSNIDVNSFRQGFASLKRFHLLRVTL